jgi:hypothetical protein
MEAPKLDPMFLYCIQLGVEQTFRPAVRLQKELALATAVKISEHAIANC